MDETAGGRFDRGAWSVLLIVAALVLLAAPAAVAAPEATSVPSPAASTVRAAPDPQSDPPSLTAGLSAASVVFGNALTVKGVLEPAVEGQEIVISLEGLEVRRVVTAADGAYEASFKPQRSGTVTAALAADPTVAGPALAFTVKPRAAVSHGALVPYLLSRFTVKVQPESYNGVVTMKIVHRNATRGTYKVRVRGGKAVFRVPLRGVDAFKLTFVLPAADGMARRSLQKKVVVRPKALKAGHSGAYVKGMLTGLWRLRFRTPGLPTRFDARVKDSVMAFRKAYRMRRTYVFDVACWRKLDRATRIKARFKSPATHIEIDKTRQIMMIVKGGKPWGIICVSTGATGNTPEGRFRIQQKHPYTSTRFGGTLMTRTMGFLGDFAMHGWPQVPPYPASHGCVREPIWACYWAYNNSWVGETVYVYR